MRYFWAVLVNIPTWGSGAAWWQVGQVGAGCCEPHAPEQGIGLPVLGAMDMWHANLERAKLQGGLHSIPKDACL